MKGPEDPGCGVSVPSEARVLYAGGIPSGAKMLLWARGILSRLLDLNELDLIIAAKINSYSGMKNLLKSHSALKIFSAYAQRSHQLFFFKLQEL